jgi:hypothetical protein
MPGGCEGAITAQEFFLYVQDARTKCDEQKNRMIRLIGLWLMGWTLSVTPVATDEDVYDGPTAIKPLTATPAAAGRLQRVRGRCP